jgi:Predicted membrane protein/domain
MQLASNFHRFISFLIDEFLITILFWIIFYDDLREISQNSALISDFVKDKIYYYYALMTVYQIFFIHKYSTTLGKMALKLEIIAENGEKISASQIWLRSFVRLISGNFLYLGFVLALFTQKRQTLHDYFAKTIIIRRDDA